jgi:hypothetical protein
MKPFTPLFLPNSSSSRKQVSTVSEEGTRKTRTLSFRRSNIDRFLFLWRDFVYATLEGYSFSSHRHRTSSGLVVEEEVIGVLRWKLHIKF